MLYPLSYGGPDVYYVTSILGAFRAAGKSPTGRWENYQEMLLMAVDKICSTSPGSKKSAERTETQYVPTKA